jgi:hypothetical protein
MRLNDVIRPFEPKVALCRAKNGELLTNKNQVLARWKEHFEEHLNEGSESEQPTRPFYLRDDRVDIDLPSREEIEGVLKYLKNNKAAGADSIAGPYLVDALHELIQHAWISETLPRSWTEGVLYPVYKKGDKHDCKNYRGICLLNVTYKVFTKGRSTNCSYLRERFSEGYAAPKSKMVSTGRDTTTNSIKSLTAPMP